MTDEEKEALEILEGFEPDDLVECAIYLQAIEKIKNLIEKQSKEIEELKEKNKKAIDFIDDKNNYFEDGENWQNILKIKEILEE